ncbi:MAG: tetratricopeptide repeat protein, partial [bacterium]
MTELSSGKRRDSLIAAALFLLLSGLYLLTAAPGIQFEDSGEFALSAHGLGVSHPPGYPLYVTLGKLFTSLPVGLPDFRLGLASGFFCALAAALLFLLLRSWGMGALPSSAAALALALSRTLWQHAAVIEVYALSVLLSVIILALALGSLRRGAETHSADARVLLLIPLALAANFANHYTVFFTFLPVALALTFFRRFRNFAALVRTLSLFVFLFAAGALLYVHLPLASAREPAVDWGGPETWQAFTAHLKRVQFAEWESQEKLHLDTVKNYAAHFISNLPAEFSFPLVFIGLLGLCLALMEKPLPAGLLAYLFAVQSAGVILLIRFHFMESRVSVMRVFFFGAYLALSVFIAWAIEYIRSALPRSKAVTAAVALPLLTLLVWEGAVNFRYNDYRRAVMAKWFGEEVLDEVERDGVALLHGAHYVSPAMYLLGVEGNRPDILAIDSHGNLLTRNPGWSPAEFGRINLPTREARLVREHLGKDPVYSAYPRPLPMFEASYFNEGLLFLLGKEEGCDPAAWEKRVDIPQEARQWEPRDFEARFAEAIIDWRRADCRHEAGDTALANVILEKVGTKFETSAMAQLSLARIYHRWGDTSRARLAYSRALELCPTYSEVYLELGDVVLQQGNLEHAAELYRKALDLSPKSETALLNLANIHQRENRPRDAVALYRRLLRGNPQIALAWNNLGNAYEQLHNREKAGECYRKSAKLDPYLPLPHLNLATLLIGTGRSREAVDELRIHLELDPESAYGYYNLGVALHQLRRPDQAA